MRTNNMLREAKKPEVNKIDKIRGVKGLNCRADLGIRQQYVEEFHSGIRKQWERD